MSKWEIFDREMRAYCSERNLGYDQGNRWDIKDWAGECDCSSLIYWCLWKAGYLEKPAGSPYNYTLYTGTIYKDLTRAGWRAERATGQRPLLPCIVLNEGNHVAAWLGDVIAQASIDERGRASGGQAGDQGTETNLRSWYVYSKGWDWYLYPPDGGASGQVSAKPSGNFVQRLQAELNSQCGAGLQIDGEWGPLTKAAASKSCAILRDGDSGNMTRILQEALNAKGYGLAVDSQFGPATAWAVVEFQKGAGLLADGEVGGKTWAALIG